MQVRRVSISPEGRGTVSTERVSIGDRISRDQNGRSSSAGSVSGRGTDRRSAQMPMELSRHISIRRLCMCFQALRVTFSSHMLYPWLRVTQHSLMACNSMRSVLSTSWIEVPSLSHMLVMCGCRASISEQPHTSRRSVNFARALQNTGGRVEQQVRRVLAVRPYSSSSLDCLHIVSLVDTSAHIE